MNRPLRLLFGPLIAIALLFDSLPLPASQLAAKGAQRDNTAAAAFEPLKQSFQCSVILDA